VTTYITQDQTTPLLASLDGEQWIIDTGVTIDAAGHAIDASGAATGQDFIVKGNLIATGGAFLRIGDVSVADVATTIKFDYKAVCSSDGIGFQGLSGGLDILNVGKLTARSTLFSLNGDAQSIENNGQMRSLKAGAFVIAGDGVTLDNNDGSIIARATVVALEGDLAVVNNNAVMRSTAGAGISILGAQASIANNDVVVSKTLAVRVDGDDAEITNNGVIKSRGGQGVVVIGDAASISNNGVITAAGHGLVVTGDGFDIINHKQILSARTGVVLAGDGTLLTQDHIEGRAGIQVIDGAVEITNTNVIQSSSRTLAAVVISSQDGSTFTNDGAVHAASAIAFQGGRGQDIVVNHGWLDGAVSLGAGEDHFTSSAGQVTGTVRGGHGNDLYKINSSIKVVESAGGGRDTVESTDSYRLSTNIEDLVLLGKAPSNGGGNTGGNHITGSGADNVLHGYTGKDVLAGGRGRDTLVGGGGRDRFVFAESGGRDKITDFTQGDDRISLAAYADIDTFKELKSHLTIAGDDAILQIGTDRILVENAAHIRFHAEDFIF